MKNFVFWIAAAALICEESSRLHQERETKDECPTWMARWLGSILLR